MGPYINRSLEPAFFDSGEVEADIDRLARKFGTRPRVIELPLGHRLRGKIAAWGDVALDPLDAGSARELATGQSPRAGILIDFINNLGQSAREGFPLYRLTGGAGFLYAASYNLDGRGTLRFLAINPSALGAPDSKPAASPPPPDTSWQDCQSQNIETRVAGSIKFIESQPRPSHDRVADALDQLCSAYNAKEQYELAKQDCNAAIKMSPSYSYAYNNLGVAYLGLKDYPNAVAAFGKAIDLKINFIWSHLDRARANEALGRGDDALNDYEYALVIDPSNGRAMDGVLRLAPENLQSAVDSRSCFEALQTEDFDTLSRHTEEGLDQAINGLNSYVSALRDRANKASIQSQNAKRDLATERATLVTGVREPQNTLNQFQKRLEKAREADEGSDAVSKRAEDSGKRLDHLSTATQKRSKTTKRTRRREINRLQKDLEATKDAEKRHRLSTDLAVAKSELNDAIAKYVKAFVIIEKNGAEAERLEKCSSETAQRAGQVKAKLDELRLARARRCTFQQFPI
jgi:tetratricopeptide (TPR) repeat protein